MEQPPRDVELTTEELWNGTGDPLIGIYLSPPRLLGPYSPDRPFDGLVADLQIPIGENTVLVTRTSGLFVRVPDVLPPYLQAIPLEFPNDDSRESLLLHRRTAFLGEAARLFNLVLCEMAFEGIVSAPASTVQVAAGSLVRGTHAVITQAGGGREAYFERTLNADAKVHDGTAFMWQEVMHEHDLARLPELRRARRLDALSSALPELVVGAYSNLSREHLPEAIVDSWVVTEQILDAYWEEHIADAKEPGRASMLSDGRSFTAAVRAEVLLTAQRITPATWHAITIARRHRNELAHRAQATLRAARETAAGMHTLLEEWLGEPIDHPRVSAFDRPLPPTRHGGAGPAAA